jgi:hypothetical protein
MRSTLLVIETQLRDLADQVAALAEGQLTPDEVYRQWKQRHEQLFHYTGPEGQSRRETYGWHEDV